MQKVRLYLLCLGGATVVTTPGVALFTAAEPKDPSHAGRQLDLGVHALDNGPPIALDLARFTGIKETERSCPSYGITG